ncbi:Dolichyl N-acetyl-alpha-D-glucosaminyl phosphate 3-beta-D-2,3-diacetamido-2,3-dideoxy-beta-D-glucuronosyltransferase [uncultured archaeon]|nr:Dolichyl N-acetyl-alpha-D-glucosaminyl phosphate 3-beta-D-2,3-diacetamido-2,3-dideoxy-beta-D-glucuronosyltransferase [uncultured archaeon]
MTEKNYEPTVSFIMPILNEEKTIKNCLDSLFSLDYPKEKMEIVIAKGPSVDNTNTILEEYANKNNNIILLENPTGNTSIGRNICIKHASGEMLMNYSGHVIAEKNLLKELAVRLQSLSADVAAVGCSNLSPGKQNFVGEVSGAAFLSFMGGRNFFSQNAVFPEEKYTDHLSFSCYRKDVLNKVGGFDPVFWCGQDYELDIRLRKAGYKILYTPKTKVYHFKRDSVRSLWHQMYRYGIARAKMVKKHPDTLRFFHLLGPGFILGGVLIVILTLLGFLPVWVIPCLIVAYLLMSMISTMQITRKPSIVVSSVLFYLLIHVGYGTGFLRGVVYSKL